MPNTSIELVRREKIHALAKIERGQRLGRMNKLMWAIWVKDAFDDNAKGKLRYILIKLIVHG